MALKKSTVTAVNKKTVNPIKPKAKQYPIYVDTEESDDEYLNLSDLITDVLHNEIEFNIQKYSDEKDFVDFHFEAESSLYTCGFLELGSLGTNARIANPKKIDALSNLLDEIVTCSKGYTLFMNTDTTPVCTAIAKALSISKYWVKVKTYINPGTKNMLTLWVTNN